MCKQTSPTRFNLIVILFLFLILGLILVPVPQSAPVQPVAIASTSTPFRIDLPGPRADAQDLVGAKIFDTGPYLADNTVHTLHWTNESGMRLLVKKSLLWTGVDMNGRMDVGVAVKRSDGARMNILGIDRYAEPVGPTVQEMNYDPYFAIEPGETLTLIYFANPFTPGPPHAHHEFDMWWQYADPLD